MEQLRGKRRKQPERDPSPSSERHQHERVRDRGYGNGNRMGGSKPWSTSEQARINKLQADERHREFLAQESQFVLLQKRKAAEIRFKEGRARPIDWLAVNLRIIDPIKDLINGDVREEELDYVDPENVIGGLSYAQLVDMRKDIQEYVELERNAENREYWKTLDIICKEQQRDTGGRAVRSVSADIDNLLRPKAYEELKKLERQIMRKLDSDEPIDTDYWQQLLDSLLVYKAKAKLKKVYSTVLDGKLRELRNENSLLAEQSKNKILDKCPGLSVYIKDLDPKPLLELGTQDRSTTIIDEKHFLHDLENQRRKVVKAGYIPEQRHGKGQSGNLGLVHTSDTDHGKSSSLFDKEAAKGVEEDEEVFTGEEHVETRDTHTWTGKYKPRKPRYFNRVQMGYEWNKYNQTHYDYDNPPPKVVQGYKFHIFYPDLIDPSKAPTYKITREGGRKKGETVAPAGEEDTCIIRFMSGPPYEDIAFRIIDRDWDYSAKHDRGFKSTFEGGILTLHFSFKKVYYRK
ncbi:hypothetical protein LTR05_001658 [Lithohypha guttulata]|uniref:Splicing factor Cactin n=1 Tax=Lithohypha guttulata TaxID=1690604 RepID=A0AAN7T883_9EURO|nr:hypothetical protein LTR05_001658 [Lithohypha guttulata]